MEICFTPARQLARLIRARKLSATEVVKAFIAQIERVNPKVNAIVTFTPELALKKAKSADRGRPLAGLPIAYKDHVPTEDHVIVERLTAAGAILIGKTNTPEFGAGSQTFNKLFGATRNPYDRAKTCGGSTGGGAVALATGMLPIADGTDMGGSLRNPASFCGVVGLRPSPGRVPVWPAANTWSTLSVDGPMARSVADVALMLSAIAGPDARSPIAIDEHGARFSAPLDRDFRGVRVAWWKDLGGVPVDRRVRNAVDAQR